MPSYSDPSSTVLSVNKPGEKQPVNPGALIALGGGILALAMAGFFYFQTYQTNKKLDAVNASIAIDQQQLSALKPVAADLTTYDTLAKQLHSLFDTQKHWEVVLTRLQTHLYKQMAVTSLQITDAGSFNFSGVTHDFSDYARIYAGLTNADAQKYFKSVKPVSVVKGVQTTGTGGTKTGSTDITFTFNITLDPSLLAPEPKATNQPSQ